MYDINQALVVNGGMIAPGLRWDPQEPNRLVLVLPYLASMVPADTAQAR